MIFLAVVRVSLYIAGLEFLCVGLLVNWFCEVNWCVKIEVVRPPPF
jgi:hypothetical protein